MAAEQVEVDVAVAGGGPVGMFLALELMAHGLRVAVFERAAERDQRLRARVMHSQTLAVLDRRDLLAPLSPAEPRTVVHFAGMECIDLSLIRADHPYALFVRQQVLEDQLEARLAELGHPVHRRHEVRGVAFQDDGTVVAAVTGPDGEEQRVAARTLAVCEGGTSGLRRALNISFDGSDPSFVAFQGLMDLSPAWPDQGWHRTGHGMYVVGPDPRRLCVIDYGGDPTARVDPADHESALAETLERVVGPGTTASAIESLTRFTDNSRIASTYRHGRAILVGDAAHVHPPFAGQGLNLGIQDAANLGWKLGLVLTGRAPESLLDTFEEERRPIADRVVELALAQSALMRPDPQTSSLRAMVRGLLEDPGVNRAIAEVIAGTVTRYPTGGYVRDEELVAAPQSLVELQRLHPTCHVVIGDARPPGLDGLPVVHARSDRAGTRVVRPDGYLAWAEDAR